MAFKMKGPMFFKSALKHRVDDNPEHREEYGVNHSEDLQTEEEHKANKKNDDLSTERTSVPVEQETPIEYAKPRKKRKMKRFI